MKQIGHLKLNGQKFQHRYSRAEVRLKEYLASMPDDELMQVTPLARAGGFGSCTILQAQSLLIEGGLACRHGARVYYGNKKAIAALKAIFASQP